VHSQSKEPIPTIGTVSTKSIPTEFAKSIYTHAMEAMENTNEET